MQEEGYRQTGAPEQQQWEQPQQQWDQPRQQPQPQQQDLFQGLTSNKTLAMVVMLGLLIIMVGSILLNATNSIDDSRHVITMGNILKDLGVFLVAGIMLMAAFYRDEWDRWFRVAVAGFALVLIVLGYFPINVEFGMGIGTGGGIPW